MTFSDAIRGYQRFSRRLAVRVATRIDAWLGTPRQICTERSEIVLGAEAIPAPIAARAPVSRR